MHLISDFSHKGFPSFGAALLHSRHAKPRRFPKLEIHAFALRAIRVIPNAKTVAKRQQKSKEGIQIASN
jgi:hypothetical protein